MDQEDASLATVDARVDQVDASLDQVDARLATVDVPLDQADASLDPENAHPNRDEAVLHQICAPSESAARAMGGGDLSPPPPSRLVAKKPWHRHDLRGGDGLCHFLGTKKPPVARRLFVNWSG